MPITHTVTPFKRTRTPPGCSKGVNLDKFTPLFAFNAFNGVNYFTGCTRVLKCDRDHVCVAFELQKSFSLAAALMDVYIPRITLLGFLIGWYQTYKTRGEAKKKKR